jgi:hypothetical protein
MVSLFIDESGSMNITEKRPFIIAVIHAHNKDRLKRLIKYFVSSNKSELIRLDGSNHKMFDVNGTFLELKGSLFDPAMKLKFVEFFTKGDKIFSLYPILVDNQRVEAFLYDNTARAFNYILKLFLEYNISIGNIPVDDIDIQIDERNEKTESKNSLCDYLNISLMLANNRNNKITVTSFDSTCNQCIQLADVFANIIYSNIITEKYQNELNKMQQDGILKKTFIFPIRN